MSKKGENKNYRFDQFLPNTLQGIPKKIAKKFKKLKKTKLAPFQAKIGWERPRKRENKNYCSDQFLPDPLQRIPKKQPKNSKNSKNSKNPLRLLFGPKDVRKARERKKKKIIVFISSYPARNREFQQNSKKIKKIKIYRYGFFSSKTGQERPRKIGNKNNSSDQLLPSPLQGIPKKIAKNFKKLKNTTMASFPAKTGWDRPKKGQN